MFDKMSGVVLLFLCELFPSFVFQDIQVRGNRLLIHGELYQRTLKQDVLKQRPSSLASKNICVDCLAIVRLVN